MKAEDRIKIRIYHPGDCREIAELFYDTVHKINARDYTEEQLNVWATGQVDLEQWDQSFQDHFTVVAVDGEKVVGFGDIDQSGYLDRLYVHADYQGQGIATAICDRLEDAVKGAIVTHASITARPCFENRGYEMIQKQQVVRGGITLINYRMEKHRKQIV